MRSSKQVAADIGAHESRVSQVVKELGMKGVKVGATYQWNASQFRKIRRRIKRVQNGEAK